MTVAVFTCVVGKTVDQLRRPTVVNRSIRYICLTDRQLYVPPYVCSPVTVPTDGPRAAELYSRELKILANHPALGAAEIVIWHDAAFQLTCDPVVLAAELIRTNVDLLTFRHPHRANIQAEAEVIAKFGYTPMATLEAQLAAYQEAGFSRQSCITSTGLSIRRRSPALTAFQELWWGEVQRWTWRDQMSCDYALWRTGLAVGYLPGHYRDNRYARWHPEPGFTYRRPHQNARLPRPGWR